MTEVKVYFHAWPPSERVTLTHVATIQVPQTEDPLDYAWRWTNNVEGSWSIKEHKLDGQANGDFNEHVEVKCPLHVDKNGKPWGHRSSMVGDVYAIDGVLHEVAGMGFREIG